MHSLGDHFTVLGNDETSADNTFAGLAGANANGVLSAELTAAYAPNATVKAFAGAYLKKFHVATTPFAELELRRRVHAGQGDHRRQVHRRRHRSNRT